MRRVLTGGPHHSNSQQSFNSQRKEQENNYSMNDDNEGMISRQKMVGKKPGKHVQQTNFGTGK